MKSVFLFALVVGAGGLSLKREEAIPPPFPAVMPEWMHPKAGPDGKIPPDAPDYTESPNPCFEEYRDKDCMPGCWSEFMHCVQGKRLDNHTDAVVVMSNILMSVFFAAQGALVRIPYFPWCFGWWEVNMRAVLFLALIAGAVGLAVKKEEQEIPHPFPAVMPEWMHPAAGPDGKIPPDAPDYNDSPNPCFEAYRDRGCMPGCWNEFMHCVEG